MQGKSRSTFLYALFIVSLYHRMDEEPSKPNFAPPFLCGKNTMAWWRRFSMRAPYTKFQDILGKNPRAYMHFLLFLIIIWWMKNHPNQILPHLSFAEKIPWPDEGGSVWKRHTLSFKIFSGKIQTPIYRRVDFSRAYMHFFHPAGTKPKCITLNPPISP